MQKHCITKEKTLLQKHCIAKALYYKKHRIAKKHCIATTKNTVLHSKHGFVKTLHCKGTVLQKHCIAKILYCRNIAKILLQNTVFAMYLQRQFFGAIFFRKKNRENEIFFLKSK